MFTPVDQEHSNRSERASGHCLNNVATACLSTIFRAEEVVSESLTVCLSVKSPSRVAYTSTIVEIAGRVIVIYDKNPSI